MTPEEIIKEYVEGKKLEVLDLPGRPVREISTIRLVFRYKSGSSTSYPIQANFNEVRLVKREFFGFNEARKRLIQGKVISRESKRFLARILDGKLYVAESEKGQENWSVLDGYPIDWPDVCDFYEVK